MRLDVWRREINFSISYAQLINIFLIVGGCIQTYYKGDLILVLLKYYVRKKWNWTSRLKPWHFGIHWNNILISIEITKLYYFSYKNIKNTAIVLLILLIWNVNSVYSIMLLDFEIIILRCILQNVKNKLLWLALLLINKAGVEIFIEMTIIIYQLTVCVCMCVCIYSTHAALNLSSFRNKETTTSYYLYMVLKHFLAYANISNMQRRNCNFCNFSTWIIFSYLTSCVAQN